MQFVSRVRRGSLYRGGFSEVESDLQVHLPARIAQPHPTCSMASALLVQPLRSTPGRPPARPSTDTQAKSDAEHCSACARYFVEICYKFQVGARNSRTCLNRCFSKAAFLAEGLAAGGPQRRPQWRIYKATKHQRWVGPSTQLLRSVLSEIAVHPTTGLSRASIRRPENGKNKNTTG